MKTPRFQPNSPFYEELKSGVATYFQEKNIQPTGGIRLLSKAIFLIIMLVTAYLALVLGNPSIGLSIFFWLLISFSFIGIGFNVMHDGGHCSFSDNKTINKLASYSLSIMGGSSHMWFIKHNVLHHTFTNVDGVDDDINVEPMMRMCKQQKWYSFHRFQYIYFVFLYSLLYFGWIFYMDYVKYFTKRIGTYALPKMTIRQHLGFWGSKIAYLIIFIAIPVYTLGFFNFIIGYVIYLATTGLVVSIVFQLAHTVESTDFPETENNKLESDWATHQIKTTANFAPNNRIVSWFVGGLNYQIEHHLFPHVSHIHYPKIRPIIKNICQKYGVRYREYPSMAEAVVSHIKYLKLMGASN